jgi:hypothetical protein
LSVDVRVLLSGDWRALARPFRCWSALHRPALAWELLRLTPSDRGQPPLTPSSREQLLSVPLSPRIASARLASTRRACSIPGASVSELSSRGPRPQFPAIACFVAAFTATNLDHPPPRRGFAAAPRLLRSLSVRRFPAFTEAFARRPGSLIRFWASLPAVPARLIAAGQSGEERRSSTSAKSVPIREHDPRIVEPRRLAACQ